MITIQAIATCQNCDEQCSIRLKMEITTVVVDAGDPDRFKPPEDDYISALSVDETSIPEGWVIADDYQNCPKHREPIVPTYKKTVL